MSLPRSLGLLGALLTVAACSTGVASPPLRLRDAPPSAIAADLALPGPARYLYVDRLGSSFDEAGTASSFARREPALLDGVRVLLVGGVALAHARAAEKLMGFRSLPERLGGGYILWSEARTYRAKTFLGELAPITDTGASGGARPYLRSILLRTAAGVIEVDPTSLVAQRFAVPGLAEALALDDHRAIQLDLLGRAAASTDGGAHFTDLLRERAQGFTTLREGLLGDLLLGAPSTGPALRLGPEGPIAPVREGAGKAARAFDEAPPGLPELATFPASSRSLPPEILAHAAAAGALLRTAPGACTEPADLCTGAPSARLLVARDRGLRLFSFDTAAAIDDADLSGVDEKFARCQPWILDLPRAFPSRALSPAVRAQVLLACTSEVGSTVLALPESLSQPRLQMTFPDTGRYLAGPHGRFAFTGRCGPQPARPADLGRAPRLPEAPENEAQPGSTATSLPEEPTPPDPATPDSVPVHEARICLRISADHWIEHRLRGPEIPRFYRWIPGEGGRVTALFLGKKDEASEATTIDEGVRVVRVDPADPALAGALFPALPEPQRAAPYRSIDEDFWEDDDGSLRGWLRLPVEGDPPPTPTPIPNDSTSRPLPLESRRGGRSAGVRIDPRGSIQVFALPPQVIQVVNGGRFALAMAVEEGRPRFFESTDGGRAWTPIEAPPTGRIEAPSDEAAPFGCSIIGCAMGGGVVRLGWGGPPPEPQGPAPDPTFLPAANPLIRGPRALRLTCHFDALDELPGSGARSATKRPPAPPVLRSPVSTLAPPPAKASPKGKKIKIPIAPRRDLPAAPAPAISLHLDAATPLGTVHDQTWTGDLWPPFQPQAALRHLSVRERALVAGPGLVLPILSASAAEPIDLLLQLGKHRLRAGEGRSFLSFDSKAPIGVAADGPDGALLLLDPDKGLLVLARGESQSAVLRLNRVPDVSRTRFTLARRLDGSGLSVIGYSTSTGEIFAGAIDLARAEVGPLRALGRIDTLGAIDSPACVGAKLSERFLAELPIALAFRGRGDSSLLERELTGTILIEANE
ncbi:MAG: hypothetical protein ABI193_17945, partial [Minicystis sp.]